MQRAREAARQRSSAPETAPPNTAKQSPNRILAACTFAQAESAGGKPPKHGGTEGLRWGGEKGGENLC